MNKSAVISLISFFFVVVIAACSHKAAPVATPAATTVPAAPVGVMKLSDEDGQKIVTAKCGRCHPLREPSEFTANQWTSIMRSMAVKAKLTEDEKAAALGYLTKNAR